MKKIIGLLSFLTCAVLAFAQNADRIVLVKPTGSIEQAQVKIREVLGVNVRVGIMQSTGELAFPETSSLKDVTQKIEAALPGAKVRDISTAEFVNLRKNQ